MKYILVALCLLIILGMVVFIRGIKNAKEVDKKQPFLNGDYNPDKDVTLKKDCTTS